VIGFWDGDFGKWLHCETELLGIYQCLSKISHKELPLPIDYVTTEKMPIYESERGTSTDTKLVSKSMISQSPELWEISFCCYKQPRLW
jgi:hypothetical protein